MKWKTQRIEVSKLKEWDKNPRKLSEKGLNDLKKSIKKFGIAEPLVVNSDFVICGGHGRLKVLQDLDIESVDCYVPERQLTQKEFEELNIRLNKNIAGDWEINKLIEEFNIDNLIDWGFHENELKIENLTEELKPKDIKTKNIYEIVIECENELEQEQIYNEINGIYKCRILTY